MEVKVSVNGIPRMVCGVTEETTCQEVVLAVAQALGQPGRYILREKFKDFERCMIPDEHLLETLKKYGEQAREVQLILQQNGPSTWDKMDRSKVGRYQPCPPLRRKDPGRRSGLLSLHRQSLPPLSCLREEAEQTQEELKKSERKSLTFMEEAWEWLESLGKGKVYSTASTKQSKRRNIRNRASLDLSFTVEKNSSDRSSRGKVRSQKSLKSDLDHQTSCCIGSQTREKESKQSKKTQEVKSDICSSSCAMTEDEKNRLRESIIHQLLCLQDLQIQITHIDKQILELNERQKAKRAEEETQERSVEEQTEQIKFWENELKAEEGYEKDLQHQFLEMKANVANCKAKLEEYKCKIQRFDLVSEVKVDQEDSETVSKVSENAVTEVSVGSTQDDDDQKERCDSDVDVNINMKFLQSKGLNPPHALVPPNQIKERRPTGPTELKEWWTRWSEARNTQSQPKKVIHRSELTIYLGNTKV